MSGYSTTRGFSAPLDTSKRQGAIFRGFGPPVPQAGVAGDIYIDVVTWQLFEKRELDDRDAWGHYLFVVPSLYRYSMKWFGSGAPSNNIGVNGDYYLQWAGYPNYGMQPLIWGPRDFVGWPENGDGPGVTIVVCDTVLPIGLSDEGTPLTDVQRSTLLALGLLDEYTLPFPVTADCGETVLQVGSQGSGTLVEVTLNTLYTAQDEHEI